MKVHELIEKLSALPPDTDVVVNGHGGHTSSQMQTKALRLIDGYMVCGLDGMTSGYFLRKDLAMAVLDLRSRYITPAVFVSFNLFAKEEKLPGRKKTK
jgi:hypothetical protein